MLERHPIIKENQIFPIALKNTLKNAAMSTAKSKWVAAMKTGHSEKKSDNGIVKYCLERTYRGLSLSSTHHSTCWNYYPKLPESKPIDITSPAIKLH